MTRARAAETELSSGGYHRLAAVVASVRAMARWRLGTVDEAVAAGEAAQVLAHESTESHEDRRAAALLGAAQRLRAAPDHRRHRVVDPGDRPRLGAGDGRG